MEILGLDLATTTGATLLDGERYLWAREFHWEGNTNGKVFRHCRRTLYTIIGDFKVKHVGVEQPLRTDIEIGTGEIDPKTGFEIKTRPPMKTFMRIYGFCAITEEVCEAHKIPCTYINQMTWRKAFLGKARATKDESLAQARLIDPTINSKDAAESLGVAWCLRGQLNPLYGTPRGDLFEPKLTPEPRRTPF